MKKKKRNIIAGILLCLLMLIPGIAYAGGTFNPPGDRYGDEPYQGWYEAVDNQHYVLHLKTSTGHWYHDYDRTEGWGDECIIKGATKHPQWNGHLPTQAFNTKTSLLQAIMGQGYTQDQAVKACNECGVYNPEATGTVVHPHNAYGDILVKFDFTDSLPPTPVKYYHLTYLNPDGASGDFSEQVQEVNKSVTTHEGPTQAGFKFDWWNIDKGMGKIFFGEIFTGGEETTYTAKYVRTPISPKVELSISNTNWTAGSVNVTAKVVGKFRDNKWGVTSTLYRYRNDGSGETKLATFTGYDYTYTENEEGLWTYKVVTTSTEPGNNLFDAKTVKTAQIDHSDPVLTVWRGSHKWIDASHGTAVNIYDDVDKKTVVGQTTTSDEAWTNKHLTIIGKASDLLKNSGWTTTTGSGIRNMSIVRDDGGVNVAKTYGTGSQGNRTAQISYQLKASDAGVHTWTITAKDLVGHTVSATVTTRYDVTAPQATGTETGKQKDATNTLAGYCQNNILDQTVTDVKNSPKTSGLLYAAIYRYIQSDDNAKYKVMKKWIAEDGIDGKGGNPRKYTSPLAGPYKDDNTDTSTRLLYDSNVLADDEHADYYLVIMQDQAGNVSRKRLITQRDALTWFHTSIDRSSYEK